MTRAILTHSAGAKLAQGLVKPGGWIVESPAEAEAVCAALQRELSQLPVAPCGTPTQAAQGPSGLRMLASGEPVAPGPDTLASLTGSSTVVL